MKITKECVPCLVRRIVFEAMQSGVEESVRTETIRAGCAAVGQWYDPSRCSARVATCVHHAVYQALGDRDPYKELKIQSNDVAKGLLPRAEELIAGSVQPLKMAMVCSIVGNMMDYGLEGASESPDVLVEQFDAWVEEGLGFDDYDVLVDAIRKAENVLLFTDNAGEIVFDALLCRELKRVNPKMYLTVVVKGIPILSDATREDALVAGIDNFADEIIETEGFHVGVDLWKMSAGFSQRLEDASLILAKGMANFECFSETEIRPIAYLLRTKCQSIADAMQVPRGRSIIKLYP